MALEDARRGTNELVLPAGEYAYTRDATSGVTFVRPGPCVVNAQAQDEPVLYDVATGRFRPVALMEAAQVNTTVPTGHYAVLFNPTDDGAYPAPATKAASKDLRIGQRVHIPGPISFALWPRQHVKVIEGHQLRSNQYLLVRVYDEQAAKENWSKGVVKKAAPVTPVSSGEESKTDTQAPVVASAKDVPADLSVGRLLIIRGTEVSFYIPPTGIEVVMEGSNYVREALTLERLQYCILIDENGNKRYVQGPNVVFPLPTERFHVNDKVERTFRPVELNGPIQGIHIKVIADYVDEKGDHGPKGEKYKAGDELFITGKTTPIYFPCEQHSVIRYDGNAKHFATAIPAGDGRYVLHRHTGAIKTVGGGEEGTMYLPDPREEVFVRRVLSDAECETMYPGNAEVLEYNRRLRELQARAPTTRKGVVSEGEVLRQRVRNRASVGEAEFADVSLSNAHSAAEMGGDEFTRSATYTEPRTVTLGNDKFSGVPKINPWTGYAVMVVDTAGNRRVEVGPMRVLLDFNETLETLALSTGKPKTTDALLKTAYLQVTHNKVADIIQAETADHVMVEVKAAFRVNFEGDDPTKWFGVSNYVKLLSDHARAILKAAIRRVTVEEFYHRSEEFIRDTLLGEKPENGQRKGMLFTENSMRLYDVEVFMVRIGDELIQKLLSSAQHEAVRTSVELAQERRRLEATKEREEISRETVQAKAETEEFQANLGIEQIARTLKVAVTKIEADLKQSLAAITADIGKAQKDLERQKEQDVVRASATEAEVTRQRMQAENGLAIARSKEAIRIEGLKAEAAVVIDQLKAVQPGFSEALLALGNQDTLAKVAEALSVQSLLGGKNLPEVVQQVFKGTPLEKLMEKVLDRSSVVPGNGSGPARPDARATR